MSEVLPALAVLVVAAVLYGLGARRIWRRGPQRLLPRWRAGCFALGLLAVGSAIIGPLDAQADLRFSMHMVQHALLVLVAAPLFALATPITVRRQPVASSAAAHDESGAAQQRGAL